VVVAGLVGNVLEWYDFGLYGLLAPVLAERFFPGGDRIAALLSVYGGFAVGFAVRPIGAAAFGHWGDRLGRRFILGLSIALMGIATAAAGVLPTYAVVGVWAPVMLVLTRLFQGFSVGGEFVGSVTYLVEIAPPGWRGLAGSVANIGATIGLLLAAGAAALATQGGAWRIPFLLGGILAAVGYMLRRHLPETLPQLQPLEAARQPAAPLRQAWREARRPLLVTILFTSGYGIVNYVSMVFLPTFAHEFGQVAEAAALHVNTAGQALALLIVPLAGWSSDRFVRRRTLLVAAFLGEAATAGFAFYWIQSKGLAGLWPAQLALAGLLAVVMGTAPAFLAEQFGPAYRVSAHAVAFNVGIGLAGGTAPMMALALIGWTHQPMAAAGYMVCAALLAAVSALGLADRSRATLLNS
jgi:MHS family proline/betaine transporter-like MFS transporter